MPNGARSAQGHHDSSKSPVRHRSQPRAQRFAAAAGAERGGGEEPRMPHPASKPQARSLSMESSQSMCAASQSKNSSTPCSSTPMQPPRRAPCHLRTVLPPLWSAALHHAHGRRCDLNRDRVSLGRDRGG